LVDLLSNYAPQETVDVQQRLNEISERQREITDRMGVISGYDTPTGVQEREFNALEIEFADLTHEQAELPSGGFPRFAHTGQSEYSSAQGRQLHRWIARSLDGHEYLPAGGPSFNDSFDQLTAVAHATGAGTGQPRGLVTALVAGAGR
jgi:hypothetical protein